MLWLQWLGEALLFSQCFELNGNVSADANNLRFYLAGVTHVKCHSAVCSLQISLKQTAAETKQSE